MFLSTDVRYTDVPSMRIGFLRHSWHRFGASSVLVILIAGLIPTLPAFASQVTADSLLGYWKFDETSGTSAADSSDEGNTGTHTNSPTISADVPSAISFSNARSLDFDGSNDYVVMT